MKFTMAGALVVALVCAAFVDTASAQRYGRRNRGQQQDDQQADTNNNQQQQQSDEDVKLPDDERLLAFHRQFVVSAEKLAADYEKAGQYDKARACYEEVVRLVPSYKKGRENLAKAKDLQATAERKVVTVMANEGWQDSGLLLAAGKPVIITSTGFWDFRMSADITPDGIEIPKEARNFPLGALIGVIDDGNPKDHRPFLIGAKHEFTPERSGRLLLRMHDEDFSDNTGKLQVTITGSFAAGGKKQAVGGSGAGQE